MEARLAGWVSTSTQNRAGAQETSASAEDTGDRQLISQACGLSCARAQGRESYARDGQMEERMRGPLGGHISEGVHGWSGGWDPPRPGLWLPCSVGSILLWR